MGTDSSATKPRKHWIRKLLLAFGLIVAMIVLAAPWILGNTSLRDQLVAMLVNDPSISVTTHDASLGYFSPFSIGGLHVDAGNGATVVEIERIQADKSWMAMMWQRPELGTFTFQEPSFRVVLPEEIEKNVEAGQESAVVDPNHPPVLLPVLTAAIEDASIVVLKAGEKQPIVDLEDLSVTFRLKRDEIGSVLEIDPVTIFDRQELTPELMDKGLQLVAPLLGNEIGADGEFSFRIDEFRIPVGGTGAADEARRIEIAGVVQLHRASVGLKDTVMAKIIGLATELLGAQMPDMLTVANDSEVKFHIVDGRVYHEGFALMLPYRDSNVQLQSSGFVSLDGELDVVLTLQLPAENLGQSKLAKMFSSDPIRVGIKGTIEDPKVELIHDKDWSKLLPGLFGGDKSVVGEDGIENDAPEDAAESPNSGESGERADDEKLGEAVDVAAEIAERVADLLKKRREKAKEREEAGGDSGQSEKLFPKLRERRQNRRGRRNKENDNGDRG